MYFINLIHSLPVVVSSPPGSVARKRSPDLRTLTKKGNLPAPPTPKAKSLVFPFSHLPITHLYLFQPKVNVLGFPGDLVVKNPPMNAGDTGWIPGPGRSHMLQDNYACTP